MQIGEDFVICKSKNRESSLFEFILSECISIFLRKVNASIDFQNQLVFPTQKIDDVDINRDLPTEF